MKKEKESLLNEFVEAVDNSVGVLVANYNDIDCNTLNVFRRDLFFRGGCFKVVKKRLLKKVMVARGCGSSHCENAHFEGHVAMIFANNDFLDVVKEVYKFKESHENALNVLIGKDVNGFYHSEDVEKLSKLPTMEAMRGAVVSTLVAPISESLAVVDAILVSILHCLENKIANER